MRNPWVQSMMAVEPLGTLLHAVGTLIPYLLVGAAFVLTYLLIPNTHVRTRAALTGGVVAAVLWVATGKLFTLFVVESAKYTAIYSGFAIVLLFMIWVFLSWLIVLVGASVAFYQQHPEYLSAASHETRLSLRMQERFALSIMVQVAGRFQGGRPPPNLRSLAETLGLPGPVVDHLLHLLDQAGLVLRTGEDPPGLVPARPPERVEVAEVMEAVRGAGERVALPAGARRATAVVDEVMAAWNAGARQAVAGLTLATLAERSEGAAVVARIGNEAKEDETVGGQQQPVA
jgi:membrane protein